MYNILFKITFFKGFFINFSLSIYKKYFCNFFYWNNDDLLHIKCHLKFLFSPWHFLMNKMKIVKGWFITEKFKTIWAMFFILFFMVNYIENEKTLPLFLVLKHFQVYSGIKTYYPKNQIFLYSTHHHEEMHWAYLRYYTTTTS